MNERDIEDVLIRQFHAELQARVRRFAKSHVHGFIPDAYFSAASSECRDLFVDGRFYGCITLVQSVSEGLAKFIAEKNALDVIDNHARQINILQRDRTAPAISDQAYAAFRRIVGRPVEDRNDFHHLNVSIEQDYDKLEARALECIEALYRIESEVFSVNYGGAGTVNPVHPQYWPTDSGELSVFLRFG